MGQLGGKIMARKKIEPIVSLGSNDDKLVVQKSRPLFALWRSELTLAEFKILDTYLSRIDSRKPDKRTVTFGKGELEQLLGVKRIRTEELDKRIAHLCTTVRIDDNTAKRGFTRISLFEKAMAEQDDDGLWKVELTCTQSAMKYIFNIENLGYLRYKLRCITSLTSRYSYIMFIYLENNRFRKSWEVSLDELKAILNCEQEETYKEYKFFNVKILKRVHQELHEKTECKYSYEPIKKGRSVVAVRFTVDTLGKAIIEEINPNQITLDGYLENDIEFWENAIRLENGKCEFTKEQLEEIRTVLKTIPTYKMPQDTVTGMDDLSYRRYHYIAQKMATMNRCDSEKKIKNRFAYFLKMLKKDAEIDE